MQTLTYLRTSFGLSQEQLATLASRTSSHSITASDIASLEDRNDTTIYAAHIVEAVIHELAKLLSVKNGYASALQIGDVLGLAEKVGEPGPSPVTQAEVKPVIQARRDDTNPALTAIAG